ncbi:MAG: replicative DNA helicase [Flavobacteriales bacterium]|jgi:replicative DNA helicase|nr:replicative DNA helicase [Flavobacteriales bacterium]MBT3964815.1 replicative DNA helicase [Flavobacteriales bacterium]MBT4704429.1 replicative DNA helicase [Flavobacteriales bacterium]MBT4931175.1 replicative DNA helicase [Flavobacteriales bacterium]MBT5132039.1 replicative DNA helicase [Flavobacteriales bacterium]
MEKPRAEEAKSKTELSVVRKQIATPEYGKLPPQAVDLEEAVLGALMLDKEALTDVIDILKKQSFYKEDHQIIFDAIVDLFQRSEPIDILTVTQELKKRGELDVVGGAFYIAQLTNRVASSANVEFHARIIAQKHIQRELIKISSDTIKQAYDESVDVFDLLDSAEAGLFEVAEGNIRRSYEDMTKLLSKAVKHIEEISKNDGTSGIPSGFTNLDRVTGGFQPSDMVVLAARPGMGKTAFVLSLARNAAVDYKKPIALFSLEMSSLQLANRLIASETEISAEKLKKGTLEPYEWEQLRARIGKLTVAPIYINDTPGLSVFELRAQCRRLKAEKDIQMVIIDYLQLMTASGDGKGNREQEISTISRAIKGIAKELNVPIIALSQLSRAVETRGGDKKPMLSDLRESGAIEQDADMVMFIYRPEYYSIDVDEEGNSTSGMAELIIAKHRNGSTEDVKIRFQNHLARFVNWENDNFDSGEEDPFSLTEEDDHQILKSKNWDSSDDSNDSEEPPFL